MRRSKTAVRPYRFVHSGHLWPSQTENRLQLFEFMCRIVRMADEYAQRKQLTKLQLLTRASSL